MTARIPEALARIDALALRAMAAAVDGPVAPRHAWLRDRWRAELAAAPVPAAPVPVLAPPVSAGPVPATPAATAPVPTGPGATLAEAYAELGFPPAMARFHEAALAHLAELLSDELTIGHLLFDAAEDRDATAVYQDNTVTRYLDEAAAEALAGARDVLELGAGRGGTTAAALRRVAPGGTYLWTDLARTAVAAAAERFARPGFVARVLDMDVAEGWPPPASQDAVLAGNALHTAADIGATLRRIRAVLRPGGRLVVTDAVHDGPALLTSMLFLISAPEGRARAGLGDRRAGRAFLDEAGWRAELAAGGFAVERVLPEAGSPPAAVGHRLFVATVDGSAALSLDGDAARVLAHLERTRATEVTLAPDVLWELAAHPALLLADLSALRRVVSTAPLADADAVRAALGPDVTVVVPEAVPLAPAVTTEEPPPAAPTESQPAAPEGPPPAVATEEPSPAAAPEGPPPAAVAVPGGPPLADADLPALVARAGEAADRGLAAAGIDVPGAVTALDLLSRASLQAMLDALRRCGLFATADACHTAAEVAAATAVVPRHRALLGRWLDALVGGGLLVPGYRLGTPAEDGLRAAAERAWRAAHPGGAATVGYARSVADHLPDLLAGRRDPLPLLFPHGRTDVAEAVYREPVTGRYQHLAVAALAAELLAGLPRPRVLEIGAGTGATTEHVLPALADAAYTITDVSAFFLDGARHRWGDRAGYGVLDVDADPGPQGFPPGSVDAIVAGGVLNAVRDTDATLAHLAALLRPGGWLLLTEPTVEEPWVLASLGFLMADPRDARAGGASFLSAAGWAAALDRAGLYRAPALPPAGHPLAVLGHRVLAARAPSEGASRA